MNLMNALEKEAIQYFKELQRHEEEARKSETDRKIIIYIKNGVIGVYE